MPRAATGLLVEVEAQRKRVKMPTGVERDGALGVLRHAREYEIPELGGELL